MTSDVLVPLRTVAERRQGVVGVHDAVDQEIHGGEPVASAVKEIVDLVGIPEACRRARVQAEREDVG